MQRRARTRWHLAFTLLNNPQLIRDRSFDDETNTSHQPGQSADSWVQAAMKNVDGAADVAGMAMEMNTVN